MFRFYQILIYLVFLSSGLLAQMPSQEGIQYGNEWYAAESRHLRLDVAQDGMYGLPLGQLRSLGLTEDTTDPARLRLMHLGKEVPLDIANGYLYFYGQKSRAELDRYLLEGGEDELLNTRYNLATDTAAYYLSVANVGEGVTRYGPGSPSAGGSVVTTITRTAEEVYSARQSKFYSRTGGNSIYFSHYELAEGFGSRNGNDLLSSNGSTITDLSLPLPAAVSGQGRLRVRFGLAFGDAHEQRISLDGESVGIVTTGTGWSVQDTAFNVTIRDGVADVNLTGLAGVKDKANLAFVAVDYPATTTLTEGQVSFSLPAGDARTLQFGTGTGLRLYDLTGGQVYTSTDGSFQLPAFARRHDLIVVRDVYSPVDAALIQWEALLPNPATNYLILSSRRLAGQGLNDLAAYRESVEGGAYSVHTVYVEDLYDHFGYGVRRHPQALRNYLFAAMEAAPDLQYLFVVGKGREYPSIRTAEQLQEAWNTFFVPGFGFPASDNLLTAELGGVTPQLATGRLAAITPEEVALYVRKLKEVESQIYQSAQTIEETDWMKQALFLGGGTTVSERNAIQYNLSTMETIFENSLLAGNVTSVFKRNSDPIEEARQDIIFDRINEGISLLTFYGHSSSQGFDFNIDNPENYHNRNKYPFMMSLGCYSGDAFTEARSIGERFIFLPEGGAIAFAASKGLGYISALGTFGRTIFDNLSNEHYGAGLGVILQSSVAKFSGTSNFTLGILMEQFSLSGDPAFRLHPRPGPDLVIDPTSVKFEPEVIPAQDSTFNVEVKVINLGTHQEGLPDSVLIAIQQELPTGVLKDLGSYRVATPYYSTTVRLQLPNSGLEAVGSNRLLLRIDAADEIAELPAGSAESNNELLIGGRKGAPFTIIANTAKTAFPPRYAVVGPGVQLIAGSSDPLAPERSYRIQVSRQVTFATTLIDEELKASGGVIRYNPSIAFEDSTTYYWRISPDSTLTLGKGYLWDASSFTYLAKQESDEVDYALQHPGQLREGESHNIDLSPSSPRWNFTQNFNQVKLNNGLYDGGRMPQFLWNNQGYSSPFTWRLNAAVQVIVVDSIANNKWYGPNGDGSYNSERRRGDPWIFNTKEPAARAGLMQFLTEFVPEGAYVILYSVQRGSDIEYHDGTWAEDSITYGRTIYGILEDEGAEQVRLLETLGSVPYTFIYQKGFGPLGEAIGTNQQAETSVQVALRENWDEGSYSTPKAGPAQEWFGLNFSFLPNAIAENDSCYFVLSGYRDDGSSQPLMERALDIKNQLAYSFPLTDISAAEYPYLQATLYLYDETDRTAASVKEIYFDYQRTGDVAISPAVAYSVPDTLTQGEVARMEIGYENLSPIAMDSMLIELSVLDASNAVTRLYRRRPGLPGNGQDTVQFDLPTTSVTSGLRMQLLLNPNQDQPEEVLFNNLLTTDLGVGTDLVAPDLKVYFDGRRISNGELVSARPEILIQLRDENSFRRLDDSAAYEIELIHPGQGNSGERIRMSDSRVEYVPASGSGENRADIYFRPELLQDGTYRLKVQAKDRSNNKSGVFAYEQEFEVLNEQLITNVLTYPNPFTTQTRFVYTLTGSAAPSTFRIQIMTVSGRVVRDIDLLAVEDIKIGTHQTEYAWDGTDEYGDQLANGVYLYRVITADDSGSPLESHQTSSNAEFRETHGVIDQYFRNGLGKVVILR